MPLKCAFSSLSIPILVFSFFSSFPSLLCDTPQQICQRDYTNSLASVIHHIHSMQVVLHYPVNDLHASITSQETKGKIKRQPPIVEGQQPVIEQHSPVVKGQCASMTGQGTTGKIETQRSKVKGQHPVIRRQYPVVKGQHPSLTCQGDQWQHKKAASSDQKAAGNDQRARPEGDIR